MAEITPDIQAPPGSLPTPTRLEKRPKGRPAKVVPLHGDTVKVLVWELPIRIFHWINALAIIVLMATGIYIGNPFVSPTVPEEASYSYLMGWVRIIHFVAAFIFTLNWLFRLYWILWGNRYSVANPLKKSFWTGLYETLKFYLFLKNKKPHYLGHNPMAQLTYWLLGVASLVMVLTGFYMFFEPQPESFLGSLFAWVPYLFGNSFLIRSWHHLVAWFFMIFLIAHVYLAIREDYLSRNGTMSSIFTGYKIEPKDHVTGED
ncbi:Ni/Fe-hydrogenase, b-type cytochrome subunit [Thermicanus aegyptius]|uniref:Ni/Fe-hydrogenase, b-type cytochrome subunit n=1 Tax=Thermicanus aegyptius TaxID=94009 RepID=UPI000405CA19|nr:Ni/Fe-hydrogenase, b-type cytochrome subunit [Thermicanus aegyptius]